MDKLIIKSSRWRYALLLLGSIVFVGMGLVILFRGKWFGLVPISFFGMCGVVAVWQLLDSRPRLVIDERGVVDRTLGVGRIDWLDIESAYIASIQGNDFICLGLRDTEKYRARLSNVRRAMAKANLQLGFTDFSLNLSGVAANTFEVFELVLKFCEVARREAARAPGSSSRER